MKTPQILTRNMGDFTVEQRTSDAMFNATDILRQWNNASGQKKEIGHFFENSATSEFIQAIIDDENKNRNSDEFTLSNIYTKKRGTNGGTWMHPLLFIDFAMWLNPTFKLKVLKFVYDQLLEYRNEAGDTYKKMCVAIASVTPEHLNVKPIIISVARNINHIVYGDHERNIRNLQAEENFMRELIDLQKRVTMYIEDGVIINPKGISNLLRTIWRRKYEPKTLSA